MKCTTLISNIVPLATGFTLLGCSTASIPETPQANPVQGALITYQCKDGATFDARFSEVEAIADLPDQPNLALPSVESASGAKYSDGTTTLWTKGEEAFVEVNGDMVLVDCVAVSPDAAASVANASSATNPTPASQRPTPAAQPTPPAQPAAQPSSTTAQASRDIRVERVQFASGATSAVVENSITGYEIIDYVLNAQAGQYANISMATDNAANYFNILAPGETEVAMFNGSSGENQYEGILPESGDYRIRVYMMRSAARRNEVANYRLEMIFSDQENPSSSPPSASSPADATVSGTDYSATGDIFCAMTQQEPSGFCPFGVVREGNGSGFVEVTKPNGSTVSIYFQNGQAVGAEGSSGEFSASRQGDETFVYIGDERYVIPDAVIWGG
ncbi:MAG: MliC family protein [Synechococcales bacterium]|nr:MliC family protein [Synechococcales bacterium]